MAISREDGSIILKTKIDESGLETGFAKMKGLAKKAAKSFAVIGAAAGAATVAITKMSVSAYADYEQLVGGVETLFKDSAGKVLEYANQAFQTAGVSANEYMQQVTSFSASLLSSLAGDTSKAADIANMALIDISDNANKMGSSMESITLAYQGFAKQQYMLLDNLKLGYGGTKTEMERLLKDAEAYLATQGKTAKFSIDNLADVYTAINAIQQKLGIAGTTIDEAETTITGSIGMVKSSWQNLLTAMAGGGDLDRAINNFVYSFEKMAVNLMPVIERTLLGIGSALQKTLPMLVQTVVVALVQQIPNIVVAVYNMIVGLFKGIVLGIKALFQGGVAKATEVIKGNIQSGSDNASAMADNMNNVADATKKAGKEAQKSMAAFDELNILSSGASGGAGETPEATMPTISTSGGGGGLLGDLDGATQEIDAQLTAIMGIAGEALVAIGLLLLFFGQVVWGLGFIIAGAVTFGVAASNSAKGSVAKEVIGMLTTIMGIAGGALLALGIILLWLGGVVGTGVAIGMIIAGASLIVSAVATKAAFSPEDIAGWLSTILGIAAGALLALGIILCMVGSTPIGVGMIIAGSVALVSAVALNYNEVTDKITGWVAVIMAIAGAALLVLGIVLCATGVAIPLGIALIALGATALVTPIALNWNAIVDWVKGAWDAVKQFWNTYIAPIFTAQWWADLGKKAINGLLGVIEKGLNWIIDKINEFVGGLSKIVGAVGDVIGVDWSIPKIPKVKIPRLAQGAVIPPNREFLAVLGDQKHGTNIEAPADLVKQMVMEAMIEMGGNFGGGNTEVVLEIDGREFGRAVVEQGNRENRRIGTRLVIA